MNDDGVVNEKDVTVEDVTVEDYDDEGAGGDDYVTDDGDREYNSWLNSSSRTGIVERW